MNATDVAAVAAVVEALTGEHEARPKQCESWPGDVQLYQSVDAEQMLLPDRASCLAVKSYLRMCRLPYVERSCANAEFMSCGGRLTKLPLLRCGQQLFAEFEPIVQHVEATQLANALSSWLDEEQLADMHSLVTYTENTCTLTELQQCYCNKQVYDSHTWARCAATHPWPLSRLRCIEKREEALRLLRVYQWPGMNAASELQQLEQCCQLLSQRLQQQQEAQLDTPSAVYLYGQRPCELDALVYGHMMAMLTTQLPSTLLADTVRQYPYLLALCRRIDEQYLDGKQLASCD